MVIQLLFMGISNYNKALVDTIKQRLPDEINPVNFLMNILYIGKEAAYRRLRGEVVLTIEEAALIAKTLGISIDQIVGINDEKISAFRMCKTEFESPTEADYKVLEEYIELVRLAANDPCSQMSASVNMFPQQMYLQYENLTRFFLFKKTYHDRAKQVKAYHEIIIQDRMKEVFKNSFEAHLGFKTIKFVLDKHILPNLINNIKYFYHVGLIRKADVELIYQDINRLLIYLEKISLTGKYESGADVYLYISNISLDKSCFNLKIQNFYVSNIETYILNGVASTDKVNYDRMEEWILSKCRLSTMISMCGDLQRVAFFKEQQSLLRTLLDDNG